MSSLSEEHFEPTPFKTLLYHARERIKKMNKKKKYSANTVKRCNETIKQLNKLSREKIFLLIIQYYHETTKEIVDNIPYDGKDNIEIDEIIFSWSNIPFELQLIIVNFVNGIKK